MTDPKAAYLAGSSPFYSVSPCYSAPVARPALSSRACHPRPKPRPPARTGCTRSSTTASASWREEPHGFSTGCTSRPRDCSSRRLDDNVMVLQANVETNNGEEIRITTDNETKVSASSAAAAGLVTTNHPAKTPT